MINFCDSQPDQERADSTLLLCMIASFSCSSWCCTSVWQLQFYVFRDVPHTFHHHKYSYEFMIYEFKYNRYFSGWFSLMIGYMGSHHPKKKGGGDQIPFAYRLFTYLVADTTSPNITSTNPSGVIAGTSTGVVLPGTGATNPAVLAESRRSLETSYIHDVPVAWLSATMSYPA